MDRVSSAGYQTLGVGRSWQNMNLGSGIQGTTFDQVWLQGVQESIVETIAKSGQTPADSTLGSPDTQLLNAILAFAGANAQSISSTPGSPLTALSAGLVVVDATAGNISITMPAAAAANGQSLNFIFVRLDGSSNTVSVASAGADTSVPTGGFPFGLNVGGLLWLKGDGVSRWAVILPSASGFSKGGSTALAFPAAAAAAGTVGSSGWSKDSSGRIRQWACIQMYDPGTGPASGHTWTFPIAFSSGVLAFSFMNCADAAGQGPGTNQSDGTVELISTNGTTTAALAGRNTGSAGVVFAAIVAVEGY